MIALGIETSCDETSCAVLDGKDNILSNIISSSLFRHKPFGGVVPEIASRHCLEQIDVVYQEAMREAKVKASDLDLIAVTQGPGLIGSLFVGLCFAKALSYQLGVPLVPVNHLEAHLEATFIGSRMPAKFIGLLVSGGHTSLSLHHRGKITVLGSTVDDAAGEAFDKVAKLMGLSYPGGPVIEKLAREGDPRAFQFTKPKQKNRFDFSFSGIKTAILYEVQKARFGLQDGRVAGTKTLKIRLHDAADIAPLSDEFIRDMAASFQFAVTKWLVEKTLDAAEVKGVDRVVIGGGVSANQYLKNELVQAAAEKNITIGVPERLLALDNAAMIARRGIEITGKKKKGRADLSLTALPNLHMG
jgi:N6-L-threonylcarbamoyladenine synthase